MSETDRIKTFLGAVRRRLLWRSSLQTVGLAGGAMLVALLVLAASAAALGPASFWPTLTTVVLAVLALGALNRRGDSPGCASCATIAPPHVWWRACTQPWPAIWSLPSS